jgi:hypothetical protein
MIRAPAVRGPLMVSALFSYAASSLPVAVIAGADGAARITLASGEKIAVPKEPDQVGIGEAHLAPDGTVGWLAEFRVVDVSDPVAGTLVLWRSGRIVRRFPAAQSFYAWTFYARGKQVAYHDGPLHGESKSHCELRDVATGRQIATWDGDLDLALGNRPDWTQGLNH